MIKLIKKYISDYIIKNNLNSNSRIKLNRLFSFSQTKNIGIIFNGTKKDNNIIIKQTIKYFSKLNISCESIGFVNKKKMYEHNLTSLNIDFFNLRDCNILGIPKSNNIKSFINKEFDLLINISDENHFIYDYIVTKSSSKFKIGHSNNKFYDLVIKTENNKTDELVKEIIFYLELINSNNEK